MLVVMFAASPVHAQATKPGPRHPKPNTPEAVKKVWEGSKQRLPGVIAEAKSNLADAREQLAAAEVGKIDGQHLYHCCDNGHPTYHYSTAEDKQKTIKECQENAEACEAFLAKVLDPAFISIPLLSVAPQLGQVRVLGRATVNTGH